MLATGHSWCDNAHMNIPKEFSQKTIDMILPTDYRGAEVPSRLRTPLHIEFPADSTEDISQAEEIDLLQTDDPKVFNAIGSGLMNGADVHYPVIDVDGGAKLQKVSGNKSKVIVAARPDNESDKKTFQYGPRSLLRDVLGDNGISLEIFDEPVYEYAPMMARTYWVGKRVTAIVMRADEKDTFDVAKSTQKDHSHLYIQRKFSDSDHATLIDELGDLGIISRRWQEIAEREGMGVVRTPWTEKAITHRGS